MFSKRVRQSPSPPRVSASIAGAPWRTCCSSPSPRTSALRPACAGPLCRKSGSYLLLMGRYQPWCSSADTESWCCTQLYLESSYQEHGWGLAQGLVESAWNRLLHLGSVLYNSRAELVAHRAARSQPVSRGLCGRAQSDLVETAEDPKASIIMENHEFGMPPANYAAWPVLNSTYDILTTSRDRRAAPRHARVS